MDHAQNHCMIHSRPDGYPVVRQHLIGWIEKGIDRDEARTVLLGLPIVIGGQPRLAPYRVGTPEQEQLGLDHVEPVIQAQMAEARDRKSTRLNSSHYCATRMPHSA